MREEFLAELVFPGVSRSVSTARHCVGHVLTMAGHLDVSGAQLVVSELVGNAVVHTISGLPGGLVAVDITAIGDDLARIDVIDGGSATVPRMREPTETDPRGRGLRIVDEMAVRWGVRGDACGGTAVWAEVFTVQSAPACAADLSVCNVAS
ncbi:anti-sigma regulatory factor (Ser/Thr protein kinase) [Nonomuraea polychroma]|uniref:Anti-sigma regulatory factor (Ser/Thr protein kinase) n=1 Tax=Nonomuraea polychroma TaxID=46176 RepID=A0A438MHZ9_9ACTN|nr:ATP-binding protein [Nonomuraea polychroma]RVX45188.1 anti-sigma regulatory factor (Ser/Thr protein kinase) [Nonomuraea polychroma]